MIKYYTEAEEDFEMDVQVGPGEEITAEVDEKPCCNSVEEAKKDANSIPVAVKKCEGCCEFFVDAADVENHAKLNEQSFLESLNDIIHCNEEAGITATNLVVVVDENTVGWVDSLEQHGATCMRFVNEAEVDDIEIQVQVGPEGEEMQVNADPQEANPVDAVKRQYDSVVVAKNNDEFFMDVEDVQKCADLNCESVIDTLNGIMDCNEQYGMTTENVRVICNEETLDETIDAMLEAGVILEAGLKTGDLSWKRYFKVAKIEAQHVKDKLTKVKDADEKAIRARIAEIDDTIGKIDEQIEMLKEDPDLEVKYVKKNAAYLAAFTAVAALILHGLMPSRGAVSAVKAALRGAAFGTGIAAFSIKGYEQFIKECKSELEAVKKRLEKNLD